jgi:hypothetical protein
MDKVLPTILIVLLTLAVFALLAAGWRNRLRRQADVAPLPDVPAGLREPDLAVEGQYVATTTAGDWLDRLAVHSLGLRTNAVVELHGPDVLIRRSGAPDLFLAADRLDGVRLERGMAGKFVEADGLVVLSWRLGTNAVDTGFRTRHAADKKPLLAALTALTENSAGAPGSRTPNPPAHPGKNEDHD